MIGQVSKPEKGQKQIEARVNMWEGEAGCSCMNICKDPLATVGFLIYIPPNPHQRDV